MSKDPFEQACETWTQVLGPDHVLTDAGTLAACAANTSGLQRAIAAVLRPADTSEVQRVIEVANQHRTPLYPISRGCNWGLGSKLPVRDGAVVLDLGRMNRIHEVNVEGHYAVVEPGVTQGQLYDYLVEHRLPLVLNVTGAGRGTSLIGNALDRGIGYFHGRADSLSGLEVVLGNGRVVQTGMGHFAGSKITHLYRYGIGPQLDGLFAQSNFGVVTRAGIRLIPQCTDHMAVITSIDNEEQLVELVDILADLRRREIIRTVIHIGNRHRTEITLSPLIRDYLVARGRADEAALNDRVRRCIRSGGFGPWSAVAGVMGTPGELRDARVHIRAALKGVARTLFMNDRKLRIARAFSRLLQYMPGAESRLALLHAIQPLYGLSRGIPTDEPLKSVYWPVGETPPDGPLDPDRGHSGMLYCLPFIQMNGQVTRETMDHTARVFDRHGFAPCVTLNTVDARAFECVISLAFDRDVEEQTRAAHACIEELQRDFISMGYIPYRVGIQYMHQVLDENDTFWQTVRDLKQVLDPNHIIAPGRYNLV